MKILVVHKQKGIVDGIRQVLAEHTPYIRYFDSGIDGLLAARVERFDLAIFGADLPVITSFELARALRLGTINSNIPVVLLADEMDVKYDKLISTLGVTGIMSSADVSRKLATLVDAHLILTKGSDHDSYPKNMN